MNRFAGAAGREVLLDAMDTIIYLIKDRGALEEWNNNVFVVTVLNNEEFAEACDNFKDIISNYTTGRYDFYCKAKDEDKAIEAFETVADAMELKNRFKLEASKIIARDNQAFMAGKPDVDVFGEYCDLFVKLMKGWYDPAIFDGYRKKQMSCIKKIEWDIQMYDCLHKIEKLPDHEAASLLNVSQLKMELLRHDKRAFTQKVFENYTLSESWRTQVFGIPYSGVRIPESIACDPTQSVFQYLEDTYHYHPKAIAVDYKWVY